MIDTHCHIDLYSNPLSLATECERQGITVIGMTNLPSQFEIGFPHILPFKKIRMALGMHPLYAEHHNRELPTFLKNLSQTSYIGEVGLDFSREGFSTKEIQIVTFESILKEIQGKKKILSIHSRRAEKEVLNLLIEYKMKAAIFHWYSGPIKLIDKIVNAGYFLSVNPAMILSDNGKNIIRNIPPANLLTESDGPYIERNGKPIEPSDIKLVIEYLAILWQIPFENVNKIIQDNFKKLISDNFNHM